MHTDASENSTVEVEKTEKPVYAKPGHGKQPHGGRTPGPNKMTRVLKEAILMAAEIVGQDGKGKDGLVGFLVKEASKRDNRSFMSLLGRVLPATLKASGNPNNFHHHVTVELVRAEPRPEVKVIENNSQELPR